MSPEELVRRGEEAQRILNHALVKEAFAALEASVVRAWRESGPAKAEAREQFYLQVHALDEFRRHFERLIQEGQFEAGRAERKRQ